MLDTNILIDLREEDSAWFRWSARRIAETATVRAVSSIVAGELAMAGRTLAAIEDSLGTFGFAVLPLPLDAAVLAGNAHHAYRSGGGPRDKMLADFLIGAHAATAGATLITRDPRRYRRYFPDLPLITPETHPDG